MLARAIFESESRLSPRYSTAVGRCWPTFCVERQRRRLALCSDGNVGLDRVREHVHPGRGLDRQRSTGGQLGVDDREVGEQFHVADLLLDARLGVLDDTPVADLAAGAGHRREVDARRRLVRDVAASLELEDVAVVGRQYRGRLGRVQRGAAADSEEQVAPERFERVGRLVYDRVCRVGDHPVVDLVLAARRDAIEI